MIVPFSETNKVKGYLFTHQCTLDSPLFCIQSALSTRGSLIRCRASLIRTMSVPIDKVRWAASAWSGHSVTDDVIWAGLALRPGLYLRSKIYSFWMVRPIEASQLCSGNDPFPPLNSLQPITYHRHAIQWSNNANQISWKWQNVFDIALARDSSQERRYSNVSDLERNPPGKLRETWGCWMK